MYKCEKCKMEVIVVGVKEPIRACNCTKTVVIDGVEKQVPSTIVADMGEVKLESVSKFN